MATGVTNQGFGEVVEQPTRFVIVFLELFEFFDLSEFFVGRHIDGNGVGCIGKRPF